MAIVEFNLINSTSKATVGRGSEHVDTWQIITDAAETTRTIRATPPVGLPVIYDLDGTLMALDIDVERDRDCKPSAQVFYYTVRWATPDFDLTFVPNPLDRPPDVSWTGQEINFTDTKDLSDPPKTFNNSTGDLYAGIPELTLPGSACSITVNEATNPGARVTQFSFSVSLLAFYGVAARHTRLMGITSRKVFEDSYTFWQTTYPLEFSRVGFRYFTNDMGFNELILGKLERMTDLIRNQAGDYERIPVTEPGFLNGAGRRIYGPPIVPVIYPNEGFNRIQELDWTALDIPNPFTT